MAHCLPVLDHWLQLRRATHCLVGQRVAVFEKADDVFHLINAADKALDDLDSPLHDWEYLANVTRLPLWLRAVYRLATALANSRALE